MCTQPVLCDAACVVCSAEVEQLTSLSLRGDATLQEYMSHLKVCVCVCGGGVRVCVGLSPCPQTLCQQLVWLICLRWAKSHHKHATCLCPLPDTLHHAHDSHCVICKRLQSLSAQLRSRELSLADAESQLAAKDEALAAAGQETSNMHKVGWGLCFVFCSGSERCWWTLLRSFAQHTAAPHCNGPSRHVPAGPLCHLPHNTAQALAALDRQRDELAAQLDGAKEEHSALAQEADAGHRTADDVAR